MRFVVLGGTGFLGRSVSQMLLGEGHDVTAVARRVRPTAQWPQLEGSAGSYREVPLDLEGEDPDAVGLALARLLAPEAGSESPVDGIVMAFGVDDRERSPLPVQDYFERRLVEPTRRVAAAAVAAGVPRLAILGSYFSWFARAHPEWKLVERHPYIAAREQQAVVAAQVGGSVTSLCVLEVPWVFGSVPGHTSQWRGMLFEPLRLSPVGFALPGATAVCSNEAVGAATRAFLTGSSPGGAGRYPVATANLSHRDMSRVVLRALGRENRRVIQLGEGALQAGLFAERVRIALLRKGSGLDPRTYAQVQARDLSIDPSVTESAFGVAPEQAEQLVADTVAASYA